MEKKPSILLTIDVEDWFQVENFKSYIDFSTWNSFELRVEKNTHRILDLLDTFSFKPQATFFILGWISRKLPDLVNQIIDRGHEVASHGDNHLLCTNMDEKNLAQDLVTSKNRLEDITGRAVYGYRAPSFAINDRILEIVKRAGYLYDSSYNSFSAHGRYGSIDLSKAIKKEGSYQLDNHFFELPVSNLHLRNKTIPFGGGGYFRLYPFSFFRQGIKNVLKKNNTFVFYAHPWEFDPNQPRVHQASKGFKFRHYINLNKTEGKLKKIIKTFTDCDFISCKQYLEITKG
ncbi:XrtA system polysaccharide deacetylase [uncultured Desulfobacter sp.]|uniref:XrtA system polysaccharide deacetylase n=1 Tax=uncultured Desulfobacter sp. TaxID=240139 RepID=UPI002AAAA612|nr:XrtA system polysaccharide deacetylase [uncultured Desulfobacter sp.]